MKQLGMLLIEPGAPGSRSKYAYYCAMLPSLSMRPFYHCATIAAPKQQTADHKYLSQGLRTLCDEGQKFSIAEIVFILEKTF